MSAKDKANVVVRIADMPEDIQNDAIALAVKGLQQASTEKEVSIYLKKVSTNSRKCSVL